MSKVISVIVLTLFVISLSVFAANKKVALIDQVKCIKCGTCVKSCPVKAISKVETDGKVSYVVDPKKCISCATCVKGCPVKVISMVDEGTTPVGKADTKKKEPANASVTAKSTDSAKTTAPAKAVK
jgi:ferredoxin